MKNAVRPVEIGMLDHKSGEVSNVNRILGHYDDDYIFIMTPYICILVSYPSNPRSLQSHLGSGTEVRKVERQDGDIQGA